MNGGAVKGELGPGPAEGVCGLRKDAEDHEGQDLDAAVSGSAVVVRRLHSEVAGWADLHMTLQEAVRWLEARSQTRCDKVLAWSLMDVAAVRVVVQKVEEFGL